MDMLRTFLTNKGTTLGAVSAGLLLLFFDAQFIATLHELGVTEAVTNKLVSGAKFITIVLAGLGYSPVKRPTS